MNDCLTKTQKSIVSLYVFFMFSFFPLLFHDYYYDTNNTKLFLFLLSTTIAFTLCMLIEIMKIIKNSSFYLPHLTLVDYLMLSVFTISFISTFLSSDVNAALWGGTGRGTGLVFLICIVFCYVMITRYFTLTKVILSYYMSVAAVVYLLGILNYFEIDPFGFYTYLSDYQAMLFISTIGNINFFGTYICLTLPVIIYSFCKNTGKIGFIYGLYTIFGLTALIVSNCDSAHLGITIILLCYLWTMRCKFASMFKICSIIVVYLLLAKVIDILSEGILFDSSKYLHTISHLIATNNFVWTILLCFGIVLACLAWNKRRYETNMIQERLRKAFALLYSGISLCLVIIIVYVNISNNSTSFGNYLIFNEAWGTGRGEIWKKAVEGFNQLPISKKMIGIGPDSFRLFMIDSFGAEASKYDNAHNEYIQYLITTGFLGFLSYFNLYTTVLYRAVKCKYRNDIIIAFSYTTVCYLIQATVNINQPITYPLFFIVFSILIEELRRVKY